MIELSVAGNVRGVDSVLVGNSHIPPVIASIGASNAGDSLEVEIEKAIRAVEVGASIVADHTLLPDLEIIHEKMAEKINVPISVVSIYEAAIKSKKHMGKIYAEDMIRIIENQAKRGIDMLTIHATALNSDIMLLNNVARLIPCTSRGGTMMLEILEATGQENPYWIYFEDILDIAKKYHITISLGTCYRPASVYDCIYHNELYDMEMKRMGELVKKAEKKGVGVIVEGIGHAPLNMIEELVKQSKRICHNAPYRVLTVSTDIALGYDHIASAIASANAVYHGADMVTCVSRSEHIGLPSVSDLCEAVISAKIAAYSGFSARMNEFEKDRIMSEARNKVGCTGQIEAAIYPQGAYQAIAKNKIRDGKKACSMCGDFCALEASERLLKCKSNQKSQEF